MFFTPLEKATDFNPVRDEMPQTSDGCRRQPDSNGVNRRSLPIEDDGGLKPPSPRTVKERSSLTGFTCDLVCPVVRRTHGVAL